MAGTDNATFLRERPGMSAFVLEDGVVYHTYSAYARGLDGLWGVYQWLDRAPLGRNDSGFWCATMTRTRSLPASVAALAATLGLAAVCWAIVVRQMAGMDMGVMAPRGPVAPFLATWIVMMAAMMLPGLTPTLWRQARTGGHMGDVLLFVAAYLAVWALFGLPVYAVYRPHGTLVAGLVTIAAGLYELTPQKRAFRARCCRGGGSGLAFGLCCIGSSIGLMLMQVSLGLMSIGWMAIASILIVGQKLLPARASVDVPVALAIVALGTLIVVAPASVPGLMPAMHPH